MKARFTSTAEVELQKAIEFYEAAENGLGAAFLAEVEATVERVLRYPHAWTAMSPRTRRCRTSRFP